MSAFQRPWTRGSAAQLLIVFGDRVAASMGEQLDLLRDSLGM